MTHLPVTVTERQHALGTSASVVIGPTFTGNYFARITPRACGHGSLYHGVAFEVRTKTIGKGSIRYREFPTYPLALEYALEWANRHAKP
jgi:hypothetical protein